MRLGPRLNPPPASTSDAARGAPAPDAEGTTRVAQALGGLKQFGAGLRDDLQRAAADRRRIGVGFVASRVAIGPTGVDTRKSADLSGVRLPKDKMSAARLGRIEDAFEAAARQLARPEHPLTQAPDERIESRVAFKTAEACKSCIKSMFSEGAVAPPPGLAAFIDKLVLRHLRPDRHTGHPLRYERAVLVATALCTVCETPERAMRVYDELARKPTHLPGLNDARALPGAPASAGADRAEDVPIARYADRLRRALAATAEGMAALADLEGLNLQQFADPQLRREAEARLQAYKLALRAGHVLSTHGIGAAQPDDLSLPSVAANLGLHLAPTLGSGSAGQETRSTLPAQALKYALARMQGAAVPEDIARCKPAFVALRNGFTESGSGSDFNRAIDRFHAFIKYADRATAAHETSHKPMGARAADRLRSVFAEGQAMGKRKSPLESLRFGTHGTTLGHLSAEKKKYGRALASLLQRGLQSLEQDLRRLQAHSAGQPNFRQDASRLVARLVALEDWRDRNAGEAGVKGHALEPGLLMPRAARKMAGLGIGLDEKAAARQWQSHPSLGIDRPRQMHLETLREWVRPSDAAGGESFDQDVRQARDIAAGLRTHTSLEAERLKYGQALESVLQLALQGVQDSLRRLRAASERMPDFQREASRLVARQVALQDWQARNAELPGAKGFALEAQALLPRARLAAFSLGLSLDEKAAGKEWQDPSALGRQRPLSMHLRTLQDWGPPPEDGQAAALFERGIRQARAIASGMHAIEPISFTDDVKRSGLGPAIGHRFNAGPQLSMQSLDDIHETLLAICSGNEVASFSDGGNLGLGGRLGFGAGASIGGVRLGTGPLLEVGLEKGRSAVFRAGVGSLGGEFFLGTESRTSGAVGAGWYAGSALPGVVQLTATAMLRAGHSMADGTGVAIRVRKLGTEWKSLPHADPQTGNWKLMNTRVVDFMFGEARKTGADRAPNGAEMWRRFVQAFGDNKDVSFNWVESKASGSSVSAQFGAAFRVGDKRSRAGLTANFGLEHSFGLKSEAVDKTGAFSHSGARQGQRTAAGAQLGAAYNWPAVPASHTGFISGDVAAQSLSLPALQLGSVGRELTLSAGSGNIRLTVEDGRLVPELCFKQREFGTASDFMKFVESKRAQWEPEVGKSGSENMLRYHRDELNDLLRKVKTLPLRGNKTFIERTSLKADAAALIDAYQARVDTLRGEGDLWRLSANKNGTAAAREIQQLEHQILAELCSETNWEPYRLYAMETSSTAEEAGYDLFLKLSRRSAASGSRDLILANALRDPHGALIGPVDDLGRPPDVDQSGRGEGRFVPEFADMSEPATPQAAASLASPASVGHAHLAEPSAVRAAAQAATQAAAEAAAQVALARVEPDLPVGIEPDDDSLSYSVSGASFKSSGSAAPRAAAIARAKGLQDIDTRPAKDSSGTAGRPPAEG